MEAKPSSPRPTARIPAASAAVAAITISLLLSLAGPAAAGHLNEVTARCTYEVMETDPLAGQFAAPDPTGTTADGAINRGACPFHTPDSDPGEASTLGPVHFFIDGTVTIPGQYSAAQASIADDIFGTAVGGLMCADFNHDHVCGSDEENEPIHAFCGTSPVFTVGQDSDGDGHPDFGWGLIVAVNSWYSQALNCDVVDAPTSTTGGVLDPAGGVYVTLSG